MKAQNSIKKIIAALLSTAVILTASGVSGVPFGLNAIAEPADSSGIISGGAGDGYYWTGNTTWEYNPTTKTLTIGGTGDMPNWISQVDTSPNNHFCHRPWGSEGSSIKDARLQINRIVIEEGVTSIGSYAFCNFTNSENPLIEISIPSSVKIIGTGAFYNSTALKSISIPDTVEHIHGEAFRRCYKLESIKLPNKLQTLGQYAFDHCSALENIILPETLTRIEKWTFNSCSSLKSIKIPEAVYHIGENSFEWCTSLTDVTIPQNVVRVTSWAFCNCTSLEHVTFEGTTTIPELYIDVFYNTKFVNENTKGIDIPSCDYLEEYKDKASGTSNNNINNFDYVAQEHTFKYIGDGTTNIIQEICTYPGGCDHTATATLSIPSDTDGLLTENGKQLFFYTGSEIKPVINTYSDNWNGTDDKKPGDIEIKYKDNILVGTAEATLTITNDDGTLATSKIGFEIVSNLKLTITANGYDGVYDGKSHSITVNGISASEVTEVKYGTQDGVYDLTENPAYTDVGEHTVYYRVTLEDGSIQEGSAKVKITPKPITDSSVDVKVEIDKSGNVTVTVKDGEKTLTQDTDYTVTTTKVTDTTTGETEISVTVEGKGNYNGNVVTTEQIDSGNKPGGNTPGGGGGSTSDDSSDTSDDSSDTPDDNSDTSYDSGDTPDDNSDTSDDSGDTPDDNSDTSYDSGNTPDNNSDVSDDSGDTSDGSSGTGESNNPNKPIEPGDADNPGNVSDVSGAPNTSSTDGDKQNPITGNPMRKWVWILMSAAGATGIAVMKSKSNRKKN